MTLEELTEAVAQGKVDTVLLAMTDMQGRLQGKRVMATHFLDEVAGHPGVRGDERFAGAVAISQEKIHTLADFWPLAGFIFAGPATDPPAREKWLGQDGRAALAEVRAALAAGADFDQAGVQTALEGVLERLGGKPRAVYQPVRVAISGTTISPGIFESVALLGREETLRRIDAALEPAR